MSKPFHKHSVKKPPHVKKFSTQRYSSLCRDSKCPTIWMLVYCGAGTSLGPQLGTSRLYGRPAFGLTPSEPWGPSLRPLGSSYPSVNSIHSWVFTITALGAVVLSKELFHWWKVQPVSEVQKLCFKRLKLTLTIPIRALSIVTKLVGFVCNSKILESHASSYNIVSTQWKFWPRK